MTIGSTTIVPTDINEDYIETKATTRMANGALRTNYVGKKKVLDVSFVCDGTDKATIEGLVGTSQTVTLAAGGSWTMYVAPPKCRKVAGLDLYNCTIRLEEV